MPYIGNPIYQSAFVTDQFSGNGSTTAYTMSVAPAGTTNVLVVVSGVVQDPSTYGVVGNTLNFSTAPPSGTGNISCRYLGVPATGVVTTAYRTVTEFTATSGQTTFTPPSYTVGYILVFRNGVLLGSADYTASNGTTVVLATGATAGDLITTESFYVSSVLNAIPNTTGSVSSSNIQTSPTLTTPTISGNLTFASGTNGIIFNNSSATTNSTLNDYETGTWTPNFGGTTPTYSSQYGYYTKIGNLVSVNFDVTVTSIGNGDGSVLRGLPFISGLSSIPQGGTITYYTGTSISTISFLLYVISSASYCYFVGNSSSASSSQNNGSIFVTSGTRVAGQITYRANF